MASSGTSSPKSPSIPPNPPETTPYPSLEAIQKLGRDVKRGATSLSIDEARFLVGNYYTLQDNRIREDGQIREMVKSGEPHEVLKWLSAQSEALENEIKKVLSYYSDGFQLGRWARSICGIGPVITAGLLAHVDFDKCKTAGSIWRFAGLDPSSTWDKGQKRPWNAALKVLAWKAGMSFVKVNSNDKDVYGHLIAAKQEQLTLQNEALQFKDAAAAVLARSPNHAQKAIYATGKLSPGHIFSRARRYGVKLFLAHFFEVGWRLKFDCEPPKPFIFTEQAKALGLGDHTHFMGAPNWPLTIKMPAGLPKLP
jgi:hypothetical protein